MTYTLRFRNYPQRSGPRPRRRNVVEETFLGADVVGLAEGGHMLRDPLWTPSYPVVPYFTDLATPVFVNPELEILGHREEMAYDETDVGSWGAGPRVMAAAWPHLVKVKKESERRSVWVGIGHHVPSVTQNVSDESKEVQAAQEERQKLWRTEARGEVRTSSGLNRVAWLMDANATPTYEDMRIYTDAGFEVVRPKGSRIDLAVVRGLEVVSSRVLPNDGSDHPGIELVVA